MNKDRYIVAIIQSDKNEELIQGLEANSQGIPYEIVDALSNAMKFGIYFELSEDMYNRLYDIGIEMDAEKVQEKEGMMPVDELDPDEYSMLVPEDDELVPDQEPEISDFNVEEEMANMKFMPESPEEKEQFRAILFEFDGLELERRKQLQEEGKKPEEIEKTIAEERCEYIGQSYYLTPDRVLDSLKKMNGGQVWSYLGILGLQGAVEREYMSCVWPNDLCNPDFLDIEKLAENFPEGQRPDLAFLKEVHSSALGCTYVGYRFDVVDSPTAGQDVSQDAEQSYNVACISFPECIEEMPEKLKAIVMEDVQRNFRKLIEEKVNQSPDKYAALCSLVPAGLVMEKAAEITMNEYGQNDPDSGTKIAIIQSMNFRESDAKANEPSQPMEKLNLIFAVDEIPLNDPKSVKKLIQVFKEISGKGDAQNQGAPDAFKDINLNFVVRNIGDVEQLRTIYQDLKACGENINIRVSVEPDMGTAEDLMKSVQNMVDPEARESKVMGALLENGDDVLGGAVKFGLTAAFGVQTSNQAKATREDPQTLGRNGSEVVSGATEGVARQLMDNEIDKDYAIYLLSLAGDMDPKDIETELLEACMDMDMEEERQFQQQFKK